MGKTILTVDDSVSIRQMISFTLRGAGYEVTEAVDGQDALDKSQRETFNLVLTDINMPRMDGLELLEKLRGLTPYKTIPILMLTTESCSEMKAKGRAAGATGWLVKPFNPKSLLEVISKVTK